MSRILFATLALCFVAASQAAMGTMKNCGDAAHNFQGTWTPEPIVTYQNLTIMISLVPAVNASTLNGDITVKYDGFPIYSGQRALPCSSLPVCPIVAGKSTVEKLTVPLNYGIPEGKYTITVNITNENNQWLLCTEIDTQITHSFAKERVKPFLLPEIKPRRN